MDLSVVRGNGTQVPAARSVLLSVMSDPGAPGRLRVSRGISVMQPAVNNLHGNTQIFNQNS